MTLDNISGQWKDIPVADDNQPPEIVAIDSSGFDDYLENTLTLTERMIADVAACCQDPSYNPQNPEYGTDLSAVKGNIAELTEISPSSLQNVRNWIDASFAGLPPTEYKQIRDDIEKRISEPQ